MINITQLTNLLVGHVSLKKWEIWACTCIICLTQRLCRFMLSFYVPAVPHITDWCSVTIMLLKSSAFMAVTEHANAYHCTTTAYLTFLTSGWKLDFTFRAKFLCWLFPYPCCRICLVFIGSQLLPQSRRQRTSSKPFWVVSCIILILN